MPKRRHAPCAHRGHLVGRLSLTRQVALLSLLPIVALGFILARVLQDQIAVDARCADATHSARLHRPRRRPAAADPQSWRTGSRPASISALDRAAERPGGRARTSPASRSGTRHDTGRLLRGPQPDRAHAAAQRRPRARPRRTPRTRAARRLPANNRDRQRGRARRADRGLRAAALQRHGPAGGRVRDLPELPADRRGGGRDKRMIALLVAIGLALLWAILYRIVARASRRLRRQAERTTASRAMTR